MKYLAAGMRGLERESEGKRQTLFPYNLVITRSIGNIFFATFMSIKHIKFD